MYDINNLKFDHNGLIPAIIIDNGTKSVLMVAYMNAESLHISIEGGLACFWSRSRGELWLKGKTSGNYLHIISITADCDRDSLTVEVKPDGPACHTGAYSCFNEVIFESDDNSPAFTYDALMKMLAGRKKTPSEGSYTSYLFNSGLDKILKKLGEETTEVIISAKDKDKANTVYELADLMYHAMVLMTEAGISLDDVKNEMASRHVIDKKVKQEKMK